MWTERPKGRSKPVWVQVLVGLALVLLFVGVYFVLMRVSLDSSRISASQTIEDRDMIQLAIHFGVAAAATLAGFLVGKWLNGLGVAYAVLVGSSVVVLMVAALVGSQTLACENGQNDLIRHWTCSNGGEAVSGV